MGGLMDLRHNPFPLIFAQADGATKLACLEFFGLEDSPLARTCLLELIRRQRADGTFPNRLDPERIPEIAQALLEAANAISVNA